MTPSVDSPLSRKRRRWSSDASAPLQREGEAAAGGEAPPSSASLPPPPPLSLVGLAERRRSIAASAVAGVWGRFHTQAAALVFLREEEAKGAGAGKGPAGGMGGASALHLFSVELPPSSERQSSGARLYLVSSYATFYCRYMDLAARERHHYEVVRPHLPCHLYFDIEFNRTINPQIASEDYEDQVPHTLYMHAARRSPPSPASHSPSLMLPASLVPCSAVDGCAGRAAVR